jgi:hypothetical protein
MKWPLLLLIRAYWAAFPAGKRRRCIFRESCSRCVYRITQEQGLISGLTTLKYRYLNCRDGFCLFELPETGKIMVLPGGDQVSESGIAERLLQ